MSKLEPITITKEYRWEMGHRLSYHTEGCQNLHGHSYRVIIKFIGTLNEGGMVFDFGDIGRIVRPIIENLDHSTMLHKEDQPLADFLIAQNFKVNLMPFHPTTEEVGKWMLDSIVASLNRPSNLDEIEMVLFETSTSTVTLKHKFQ